MTAIERSIIFMDAQEKMLRGDAGSSTVNVLRVGLPDM